MRRAIATVIGTVGVCAIAAAPASAAAGTYGIAKGAAAYVTGTNRIASYDDDGLYFLSTTSSAPYQMPWPVVVYGKSYSSMYVSTNGNIQLGTTSPSAAYTNSCLPTTGLGGRVVVAPFWDDIDYNVDAHGVFTKSYRQSGKDKFLVSWRGELYPGGAGRGIRAEVIFTRGSSSFEFRYAEVLGNTVTIGVQKTSTGPASVWTCNRVHLEAGNKLTFAYHS